MSMAPRRTPSSDLVSSDLIGSHRISSDLISSQGKRILFDEATNKSASAPGEKGPGGPNGPYQTLTVPLGWVVSEVAWLDLA